MTTNVEAEPAAVSVSTAQPGLLLAGRRVRVSDLLDAGLLTPGVQLAWDRPKSGEHHLSSVREDGSLEIHGGASYRTPSRAAMVAAGVNAVDGWLAWAVVETGETLDVLRRRLLHAQNGDIGTTARREWLEEVRASVDRGEASELTVVELLQHWDAETRDSAVTDRIDTDLDNQGLTTHPDYRAVPLTESVALVRADTVKPDSDDATSAEQATKPSQSAALGVQLKVSRLPSASMLASVTLQDDLEQAITRMLVDDYSQLAVLAGSREVRGAVTWKSIAQAKNRDPAAKLLDAVIPAEVVNSDDDLLGILGRVQRDNFVFVRNPKNRVVEGIVTTADVVGLYGEIATPFFLIGEIDYLVRRAIAENLTLEEVQAVCGHSGGKTIDSFSKMSMGDYTQTLGNPELWRKLGWAMDRKIFVNRLNEVRRLRNSVMHFNPDPPSAADIAKIRQLLDVLRPYVD